MKVYVASSWRNDYQQDVVRGLRELDHEVYDFRNPSHEGPDRSDKISDLDGGFHWSDIDPNWQSWSVKEYIDKLQHPIAESGFLSDWLAMEWAEACVLVMPCGRSAHLEAGYFVGAEKPLLILASKSEPELMYKMAHGVYSGLGEILIDLQDMEESK